MCHENIQNNYCRINVKVHEWLKPYSEYKWKGLTSNTSSQPLTGTPGLNLIRSPACSPEAPAANKSQQRWFRWEPQKRQTHTHACLRSRHKRSCANEMENKAWTSAVLKQTQVGLKANPCKPLSQASCLPAGCLLGGFVCLITSQWGTQSQTMLISIPSLQPPISVLTSGPGLGAESNLHLWGPAANQKRCQPGDFWMKEALTRKSLCSYLGSAVSKGRNAVVEPTWQEPLMAVDLNTFTTCVL